MKGELKKQVPYTITGLARALECDKETIRDYRERDEFSAPIKEAYLRVEQRHELNLHRDEVQPAKTIFALSNFGWKNPQHIEQKLTVEKDGAAALASSLLEPEDVKSGATSAGAS